MTGPTLSTATSTDERGRCHLVRARRRAPASVARRARARGAGRAGARRRRRGTRAPARSSASSGTRGCRSGSGITWKATKSSAGDATSRSARASSSHGAPSSTTWLNAVPAMWNERGCGVEAPAQRIRHRLRLVVVDEAREIAPARIAAQLDEPGAEHDARDQPAVEPDDRERRRATRRAGSTTADRGRSRGSRSRRAGSPSRSRRRAGPIWTKER